ncbi:MAG: hypothetical protein ACI4D7_09130 [Lachnospiraceae bacterium]
MAKTGGENAKISKKIRNQGKNSKKTTLRNEIWLKEAETSQIYPKKHL